MLDDRSHQLGPRAVARIVLDIVVLACDIAWGTARQWGETAIAFQPLTMAGGTRHRLAGAASNHEVFALFEAANRRVGDEPGPRVTKHFGCFHILRRFDDAPAEGLHHFPF